MYNGYKVVGQFSTDSQQSDQMQIDEEQWEDPLDEEDDWWEKNDPRGDDDLEEWEIPPYRSPDFWTEHDDPNADEDTYPDEEVEICIATACNLETPLWWQCEYIKEGKLEEWQNRMQVLHSQECSCGQPLVFD